MRFVSLTFFACASMCITASASYSEPTYICRSVGAEWTWFGDHVALSVSYATRGPRDRTYEVGTGLSVNGSPWGSRSKFSGDAEFSAYGIGALHIRRADAGADFDVCSSTIGLEVIPIVNTEF
jgi:hypothetical protein